MNKKTIVFIELLVCVISIVVISIFGNNPETWRDFKYCKSISFLDDCIELDIDANSFQLSWIIGPESATITDVIFISNNDVVDIDKNGLVSFKKKEGVTVIVMTTDGSELKDSLTISFKAPSNGTIELD